MGVRTGVGLKFVQFFFRGITFGCAAVVLGIYAYFLATMHTHKLTTPTWVRAVEGLAGSAALYSLIGLLLLWCLAGHALASFVAMALDVAFIVAFIYIAAANRGGATTSCKGTHIRTPYGTANSNATVVDNGHGSTLVLPSIRTACKLETASLAVAVIAIVALVCSAITESLLARNHRRQKAYGTGTGPNGYASAATPGSRFRRLGPFGRRPKQSPVDAPVDANALPAHTTPAGLGEKPPATYGNHQNY